MFCPPSEENIKVDNKQLPNRKASQSNRKNKKHIKKNVKRNTKLSRSMSSWAENFTFAATWQLKQQVAFWKARAKALEYENSVLHDVIRRNQCAVKSNTCTDDDESSDENIHSDREDAQTDNAMVEDNEDDEFEVSEQFITFLTANAKYKEDAKRERERLKAQLEAENQENVTEEIQESAQETMERMRNLYGDKWQRISALEMTLLTNFIQECDQNKPSYWPNIPFNFKTS